MKIHLLTLMAGWLSDSNQQIRSGNSTFGKVRVLHRGAYGKMNNSRQPARHPVINFLFITTGAGRCMKANNNEL